MHLATNKVKTKVIFAVASAVLFVVSGIVLVTVNENKSYGRIWGYFIAYVIIAVFVLFYFLKLYGKSNKKFKSDLSYALSFSIQLIPHILANLVNGRIDIFFIMQYAGENQVGIYSVAYSVGGIALTFAGAATDAWTPWYYDQTREENDKVIARYYKVYTLTIGMCFFGVMMLSQEIMNIMAPLEYGAGIECIPYISIGIYFLFMYRFPLCYEQLLGNTKYVAPATIIAAAVNVLLNAVWIPDFGINGAAFATSVSYAMLWIFHEIVARFIVRNYNIHIIDSVISFSVVLIAFIVMVFTDINRWIRYMIIVTISMLYLVYIFKLMRKNS